MVRAIRGVRGDRVQCGTGIWEAEQDGVQESCSRSSSRLMLKEACTVLK